ncbi:two-component system, OmpR family, sensor histidine kinase KdpD [Paraburkholderia phenazinium]|uniref:histidine kinase n=2 Tax=Paraburkholderia phenazinium TaxID=60549 RepID=A0A1G8MCM8_9BURK|nr:two-component system, OmpR family, sensor histidine kinase KdpD [Paraburkholderia phenazinium]
MYIKESMSAERFYWPLVLATLACAATTVVASQLLQVFDLSNVVGLFLFTVVLVALCLGRVAGAWTALLSVASFDFFFVTPRFSFAVSDAQYLFTFVLILAVALVTGQLAAQLRLKARVATAGEHHAVAVARVARELSGALRVDQISAICSGTIAPLFAARVALVLPDSKNELACVHLEDFVDTSIAQWSYDHVQPAGISTPTLPGASALYLPLKAPMSTRGVLAVRIDETARPSEPADRRLLEACCSLIALALERTHFVEIAQDTLVRMEGERLRSALLAAVSHDLKTPLTAIRGLAETLEQTPDFPAAERVGMSRAIRMQSESLHRLVTNLLDLARMQSEGVRLNKEWNDLGEVVGSALARLFDGLAAHEVRTQLAPDLPLIELDAIAFERVLVNLLDNAAKYTPAGTRIVIRSSVADNTLHLFVEDNGPGLPGLNAEHLFEPFTRGIKESSISGVGLGLALCRTIVAAHGGTIRAQRLTPHGVRFEICLPIGTPPEIEQEIFA